LQLFFVDLFRSGSLFRRLAWQEQTGGLLVNGADKAAAVKSGFGTAAPASVGHAQKTKGSNDQIGCGSFDPVADFANPVEQFNIR